MSRRPVIIPDRTPWDRVAEFLALVALAFLILVPLMTWSSIPGQVPRHFGFTGTPTAWADRATLIFPIVIGLAMYVGLTLLNRVPHVFNYLWPITQQNAYVQYRLARSMLTWLKLILVATFAYLTWGTVQVAEDERDRLHWFPIIGFLVGIHVVMGVFIVRMYTDRHGPSESERKSL